MGFRGWDAMWTGLSWHQRTHAHAPAGHNYIGTEHILLGLLREGEGVAARVLETLGADPAKIRTQVSTVLKLSHGDCVRPAAACVALVLLSSGLQVALVQQEVCGSVWQQQLQLQLV